MLTRTCLVRVASRFVAVALMVIVSGARAEVTTLASFPNGSAPFGGVVQGQDGFLYGTTTTGGGASNGTIYKLSLGGELVTLHTFAGGPEGKNPYGALVYGADGHLYGMASLGGADAVGTLFRVSTNGEYLRLRSLDAAQDGAFPFATLIRDSDGRLYGTASSGGLYNAGTVFRAGANGGLVNLHSFAGFNDGAVPYGRLVQGPDGTLYGTTPLGGAGTNQANHFGTVFRLATNGAFAVLKAFTGTDGAYPYGGLTYGRDGNLYGTTRGARPTGGTLGLGTIFRISPTGVFTNLYSFTGGSDGASPYGALLAASDGALYGTTSAYTNMGGTLFKITLDGAVSVLTTFNGANGSNPYGELIQGVDGNIYGTTTRGGVNGGGTVFRQEIVAPPFVLYHPANVTATNRTTAKLSVVAGGTGPLTYRWLHKGVNLTDNALISGAHTSTLTLTDVASSNAGPYTVLISNPHGQVTSAAAQLNVIVVKPEVSITSPPQNRRLSNEVVMIAGKASGKLGVTGVYYRVNDGDWTLAGTTNGWANWSGLAMLAAGTNIVQAYAADSEGRVSVIDTARFFYVVSSPLTLTVNGSGTVTPNLNGASLEVGRPYTLTAKPARGFAFTGWTGSIEYDRTKLKFVMETGMTFTASFVDVTRPILKVKSPKKKMRVTAEELQLSGKTRENAAVAGVFFQLNEGDWNSATTSDGFLNWTGTAMLAPGTNVVRTYALDVNGLASITNVASVVYQTFE